MNKKINPINIFRSLFIFSIFIGQIVNCSPSLQRKVQYSETKSPSPIPPIQVQDVNTLVIPPTPEYIISMFPIKLQSKELYDKSLTSTYPSARGIILQLRGNKLGLKEENISAKYISKRAMLFINGNEITNDSLILGDGLVEGYGPYFLSWAPQLALGLHEATFRFLNDDGETLEYTWQFILKEE